MNWEIRGSEVWRDGIRVCVYNHPATESDIESLKSRIEGEIMESQVQVRPDVKEAVSRIRKALKQRSGKAWSVTKGRGSVWGWIYISLPDHQLTEFAELPESARKELAGLLGLDSVHQQGVNIPDGSDYRQEYVDRAEGRAPSVIGKPYWD